MKILIVMCSLFLGLAQAADRTAAYNKICKPMTFESDRAKCLSRIKQYNYFDSSALSICAMSTFDEDKVNCLDLIGDKFYEGYEITECRDKTFESERWQCLKESGTPYNPDRPTCVSREEAIEQLSKGIKDLRSGNLRGADQRMSYLLSRYTDCR